MPRANSLKHATANKPQALGDATPQLQATPKGLLDDSIWDDLAKTAESAKNRKDSEQHHTNAVATEVRAAKGWKAGSLDSVQRGITLNYIGVILNALAVPSALLVVLSKELSLLILAGVLLMAASLLSIVGRIFCLAVPQKVQAHTWIYLAVFFDIAGLLANVSKVIPGIPNLSGISGLASLLATVLFIVFLRKLATYINATDLVQKASELLIQLVGLTLFFVAGLVVFFVSSVLGGGLLLFAAVMAIFAFLRYFQLLSELRLSLG